MRLLYRYTIIIFLLFTVMFYGQVPQDKIKAKLEIEKIEGNVKITGTAENLTDVIRSAAYRLSVIKKIIKIIIRVIMIRLVYSPCNQTNYKNYLLPR